MNSLKLGACALPLFALLLLSGCGVANPVAPTVAAGSNTETLTYQIDTEEGGGAVSGGGSVSGAGQASGGTTQAPRGKKIGHDRHPRPRN